MVALVSILECWNEASENAGVNSPNFHEVVDEYLFFRRLERGEIAHKLVIF